MQNIFLGIKSYIFMLIGVTLFATGLTAFLIPHEIVGGGIAGLAFVIYYATGINTGITYFGINTLLILLAMRSLGAAFGVKTIVGMVYMTILLSFFQDLFTEPVIDDRLLSAILGGIICGIGMGVVFGQGGSMGGTDIIAMVINKYRNISPGKIILTFDAAIILSSFIVFEDFNRIAYGFVWMGVTSYALDSFLNGAKQCFQLYIVTPRYQRVADYISTTTGRGVTVINGEGWYCKNSVNMLMSVIRKRDSARILKGIKSIDPNAFITQNEVRGVFGKAFGNIKY